MTIQDALQLKRGQKVWVDYTPEPGHGKRINCVGTVKTDVTGPPSSHMGMKYIGVVVEPAGGGHSSVYPSWCLSKI